MVRATWNILARLALAGILVLSLTGCDLIQEMNVRLVDFDTSQVEGVSLWRLDTNTGQWQRRYVIHFTQPYVKDGVEYVDYALLDESGNEEIQVPAELVRDPANPAAAELSIAFFVYDEPSDFKVAAFNAEGESPLSDETLSM